MKPKERIPLHDHTDNNSGGQLSAGMALTGGTLTGGGGTSSAGSGGISAEDARRFMTREFGGQETVNTVAASGSTETLDLATGNVHDVTLTADCAITTDGWVAGVSSTMTIVLREDGTGGWDPTFTDTIDWLGGISPTFDTAAGAQNVVVLWSFDGGTTIGGTLVGNATPGASALDDLTDVTLTAPGGDDTLRYVSGAWINDNRRWEPVTTNPGGGPEIVWDGDDIVMTWRAY